MNLTRLTPAEYAAIFDNSAHIFNTTWFALHNASKCRALHLLAFSDSRLRAGIILGQTDTRLESPFSAPFGGLTCLRRINIATVDTIYRLIHQYSSDLSLPLRITLPPVWHNPALISQSINSLSRIPGAESTFDLSHHFDLATSQPSYQARRDTRTAIASPLMAATGTDSETDVTRAYKIIALNHARQGNPMNMTLSDMVSTCQLVGADTFFITDTAGTDIAAAIVYTTLPGVAQIIVWGHDTDHAAHHPMHLLFHHIRAHYTRAGYHTIDIGPSTLHAAPNPGLCNFKESLGCTPTIKPTLIIPPR